MFEGLSFTAKVSTVVRLLAISQCASGALADAPIQTPVHPVNVSGVTSYLNAAGNVVATSTWTVQTSGGTRPGDLGFASINVTIQNLSNSCSLTGYRFGMNFEDPSGGGEDLEDWALASDISIAPGQSYMFSGSMHTVILPSQIDGVGFEANGFWDPDPSGNYASKGSLPYSYGALPNTCFGVPEAAAQVAVVPEAAVREVEEPAAEVRGVEILLH